MKDLIKYTPLESFFTHRFWWRCSIIRQTTGRRGLDCITVVNAPCFIAGHLSTYQTTDYYILPQPNNYHLVIPAAYIDETTREVVRLQWGPDADIYEGDTLFVAGLPFLLQVRELRNPASIFSHFELNCTPRAGFHFRSFSDFLILPTTYSIPEQPIGDIKDQTLKVLEELEKQETPLTSI